jgi:uncharacterized protein YjbI with pentapeptide repeats
MERKPKPTTEQDSQSEFRPPPNGTRKSRWGFRGKTVWDWLDLLLVPLILGIAAVGLTAWFNAQQDARQNAIEERRAEAERELAEQRAQDEALQAYFDQMSTLLLEKDLRSSEENSEVRTLARARTLTVLRRLDPDRKGSVVQFLHEASLIQPSQLVGNKQGNEQPIEDPIIKLIGADLREADLREANLIGADLREVNLHNANLHNANLNYANLRGDVDRSDLSDADISISGYLGGDVDLTNADLSSAYAAQANLNDAELTRANLNEATLSEADLSMASLDDADLSNAYLIGADLGGAILWDADLDGANLSDADLSYADLTNAQVTQEQLGQAKTLKEATMPNGQKYEEWLKSKGRGEDGENSDLS